MCSKNNNEIQITRVSIAITLSTLAGLLYFLVAQGEQAYLTRHFRMLGEVTAFGAAVLFLIYGNFLYQWCRLGYYQRKQNHNPASRETLEQLYDGKAPSLAILVPSYKEERRVVWQTMVSAALTEYPEKSVVLLIDDPYQTTSREDRLKLEETRSIPTTLQNLFHASAEHYHAELVAFRQRAIAGSVTELERLAELYRGVSEWFETLATDFLSGRNYAALSHTDKFFLKEIIQAPAQRHAAFAEELREKARLKDVPDRAFLEHQYIRLAGLFNVSVLQFRTQEIPESFP